MEGRDSGRDPGGRAGDGAGGTVADVGEFGLIRDVTGRQQLPAGTVIGPGDDAAVVAAPDGRVVISTDVLVQGVHFRLDWSSPEQVGHKAAAVNLADIAAMGATPTSLVVGFGCPADTDAAVATGISDGLTAEAARVGAGIVGGDVVRADQLVVSVTALGDLGGRAPVTRSGARPGHIVAVCGRLGWAAAGLAVLGRGFRSPVGVVNAQRAPEPPYTAGPAAADAGATAMIDVSDGLLADLGHLAEESDVGIDIASESLEVDRKLVDVANALGADPMRWVLTGGEDHALVATFPSFVDLPQGWRQIGTVLMPDTGVTVDGKPYDGDIGWEHWR
ncbi:MULTISPECIES: thiamine-phosphate kinase [Prauserella salsuginis group]|uniref:Thiamine-monophosphate kinase n=2 Tax=Prauserella salsuginis group TaxID=2893672 RepID=A0A839XG79_9PSEU|nr:MULTISPECIES: thiamine-phosphate kinase [Prauserella salsuginis group]MBB3661467.1 thiamine-monophosphate kinase [Prauserella sediminis]MCR3719388.1 thiamine-monophosphate kinase [Prauserella flava]MCR3735598.1 thiamine-monophosphate kinase [Prauserella salsuginis]